MSRVTNAIADLIAAVQVEADHELARVNQALRDAGIEYPLGARGVADLAQLHQGALDHAAEIEAATASKTRASIAALLLAQARSWPADSDRAHVLRVAAQFARDSGPDRTAECQHPARDNPEQPCGLCIVDDWQRAELRQRPAQRPSPPKRPGWPR